MRIYDMLKTIIRLARCSVYLNYTAFPPKTFNALLISGHPFMMLK
uniref:Uncharacterized protein n=1 Tax=Anguilla anguilla TaxID=7936 RepID=A0A0E9RFD5_ANGAN